MSNRLTCPHGCGVTFRVDDNEAGRGPLGTAKGRAWEAQSWVCPECDGMIVDLVDSGAPHPLGGRPGVRAPGRTRVWPRSGRKASPLVPDVLRRDFEEASAVLDTSPRAAAALARRCLQTLLRDHLQASGANLHQEIDSLQGRLPSRTVSLLHGLKETGNTAAHPSRALSGEIIDVDEGEADFMLELLAELFDEVFEQPARQATFMKSVNEKREAAGKSPIVVDGIDMSLAGRSTPRRAPTPPAPGPPPPPPGASGGEFNR